MLMDRFSAGERFEEMLPKDDVLRAELSYVGLLGVHQLQSKSNDLKSVAKKVERREEDVPL